ncbi:MAG: hypothetical protein AB7G28_24540 [Pirellulales bacterium]
MRLTLRTLLAYMDEILEPSDREELAKKVESSEFAHDLIHRTKDTMRRLRLSAPQVLGTGMALDPNTVAEYLDNMLPPESVADFERICLESDVHLAEVASAHHVLTMVLGEPAEVDPLARQRMYGILAESEIRKHAHAEPVYASPAAPANYAEVTPAPHVFSPNTPPAPHHAAPHADVPDYLRANSWTRHGTLLAACAAVLLLAVGWLIYTAFPGWFGQRQQVAVATTNSDATTESDATNSDMTTNLQPPANPPVEPGDEVVEEEVSESVVTESVEAAPETSTAAPSAEASAMSAPSAAAPAMAISPPPLNMPALPTATQPTVTSPAVAPPTAATTTPPQTVGMDESDYGYGETAAPAENQQAVVEQPAPPPAATEAMTANVVPPQTENPAPQPTDLATSTPAVPPQPVVPPQSVTPPQAELNPPATNVADSAAVPGNVAPAAAAAEAMPPETVVEAAPAEPVELGTYLDGKNVLLRFDPQSGAWFRLAPRSTLQSGDKLLALPAFYPKLALASGLHVKLSGGSLITLGSSADGSNEPAIEVAYGKVVFVNTSNEESGLKLSIGGQAADVRLGRNATLAIDAVPKYQPGQDPRKLPAPLAVEMFARDGNVTWTDAAGKREIPAPAQWKMEQGVPTPPSANAAFPDWIDQEPFEQRSEKLYGAPAVEVALHPARPVEEQLLELYESSRRREVKSLVARSSVYAGLFVPFVEALRDSDQKASWKMHIDTLRSAMALGPDSAERIYQTLVEQRGKQAADDLYQMLCGYDPGQFASVDDFRNGLGTQLVDWMENDSLDYRVLAVQDMSELTGMRLMSNPAGAPTERARGVRLWRQRLKDGEIELAKPATP